MGEVYKISNKNQLSNRSVKYLFLYTKSVTYLHHFQSTLALFIAEVPGNIFFLLLFYFFLRMGQVFHIRNKYQVPNQSAKKLMLLPKRLYITRSFPNTIDLFHQRCIQNPVKHLRWILLRKQLTTKSHQLFSQKTSSQIAPSQIFKWVLKTPLSIVHIYLSIISIFHNRFISFKVGWYGQDSFSVFSFKKVTLFRFSEVCTFSCIITRVG